MGMQAVVEQTRCPSEASLCLIKTTVSLANDEIVKTFKEIEVELWTCSKQPMLRHLTNSTVGSTDRTIARAAESETGLSMSKWSPG